MGFELKDRIGVSNVSQTTLSAKTPGASGTTVAERARNKKAADPVCIEMPVRVRGIGGLPIAGTNEIGQDFSEDTRTLIVMATGAVVRMATRVKKGQLLGLRHLRTEQEVSCRVLNVRGSGTPEDYVEVEFTQRAIGFWGIHFPNDPKDEPPVVEAAPTPGEIEAERVIFGGGHTERGNITVGPTTAGIPANAVKPEVKAGAKANVKIGADRGSSVFADVMKTEPGKAAPIDAPGFSGLSKSAEEGAAAAERVAREDALIQQQTHPNIISFPGPATHQEKANILSEPEPQTQPLSLDFSPVEGASPKPGLTDAEVEHAAIAKAIEEKAAREKAEAERRKRERAEAERIEAEKRAEAERKAAEAKAAKAAAEKAAAEKAVAEKAAAERLAAAQAEFERQEAERRAAERAAAAERTRLFAEVQKKREADRLAAEIAARAEATDGVEVTPSLDAKRDGESLADAPGKESVGRKRVSLEVHGRSVEATPGKSLSTGASATAYGTLEEEIQRDRAALKTAKGGRAYLMGAAAGAVFVLLAAGGRWYMHSSAKVETPRAAAPSSLPPSGTPNSATSGAAAVPAGALDNSAAANATNLSGANPKGAKGAPASSVDATTAANASNTSGSSGSSSAAVQPQPVQPPIDNKKTDNRKTASARDSAASAVVPANQPAKDDSTDAAKPTEARSKPVLNATLSAPVVVKRDSAAGDVAAPDIEAAPMSGEGAPLIGAVTSTSVAPAAPPTGGHVVPPHLLKAAAAEYPALARQRHIEGDVVVEANISVNGNITSVKVLSGSELLRQAALNAVRQFKYAPAQLDGAPTTSQVLVTVKFHTK